MIVSGRFEVAGAFNIDVVGFSKKARVAIAIIDRIARSRRVGEDEREHKRPPPS